MACEQGASIRVSVRRAFTLIELLTVMAITAIMLTIIVVPIIQTFNLTRTAQAFQEGQDRARIVMERISREVSNSAGVRNNTGIGGQINVIVPSGPGSTAAVVSVPLRYAKLDIMPPAQEGDGDPVNGFIDPNTGKVDPTLKSRKGQIALMTAPGTTITRYFVALRDPFSAYNNPYQVWSNDPTNGSQLRVRGGGRDNLFVLYRAEVPAYKVDRIVSSPTFGKLIPNNDYFYDQGRSNVAGGNGPWLDDPDFFNPSVAWPAYTTTRTDDKTKAQVIQDWLDKATVVTELSRYDMIMPFYDRTSLKVVFDPVRDAAGNIVTPAMFAPRLISMVSFRPSRVSEGAAEGSMAVRPGEETDNSATIAPDVFSTKNAGWANAIVTMYPVFTDPTRSTPFWTSTDPFTVGRMPYPGQPISATGPFGTSIYGIPGNYVGDPTQGGIELFDIYAYDYAVAHSNPADPAFQNAFFYPFSYGLNLANSRSGWLTGALRTQFAPVFAPYDAQGDLGRLVASFGIDQVGAVLPPPVAQNLPFAIPGPEVTPANDLPGNVPPGYNAINTGVFSDSGPKDFSTINRKFDKVWYDYPNLRPDVHRFIDLRVAPQLDGSLSPLYPNDGSNPPKGFARARIVPGSEIVYGPDQRPGANYGQKIRYTRTTNSTVGPNQYRINYVDQPEPDYVNQWSGLGLTQADATAFAALGGAYSATNFISAVHEPRYKAGYIQLNSDPTVPLPGVFPGTTNPVAPILVYYKFQFTQAVPRPGQTGGVGVSDTFSVDYDSRQLMTLQVSIRNYPQSSVPSTQIMTLKADAAVRNYLR